MFIPSKMLPAKIHALIELVKLLHDLLDFIAAYLQ